MEYGNELAFSQFYLELLRLEIFLIVMARSSALIKVFQLNGVVTVVGTVGYYIFGYGVTLFIGVGHNSNWTYTKFF